MNTIRMYIRYLGVALQGQMQYRASFVMQTIGILLISLVEFLAIWALFDRFNTLRSWTLAEVALLYGMINIAFALSEMFATGFHLFDRMVLRGDFDRILLRPRGTILQVMGHQIQLMRIGRLLQGVFVLAWATWTLQVDWSIAKCVLVLATILSGTAMFTGLFILQATVTFWSTQSLELANTLTYGGVETAQFPMDIYHSWFRRFFTMVIPLACVNYLPSLVILGRVDHESALWHWASPAVGLVFLFVSFQVWHAGTRHYQSTGS